MGKHKSGTPPSHHKNDTSKSGKWPGGGYDTDQDSPLMYTQKVETLEPFSSHVIPMKMVEVYLGERLNVMVEALYAQDGTLPPGLTMQNMYTELRKGSKKAVVMVQNNTAYPQTLQKKTPVARAMAIQPVPKTPEPGSLQVQDEVCPDPQTPKLMIRQRHGRLSDVLDLSGLDLWAPNLADKAHWLLAQYHQHILIRSGRARMYPLNIAFHKSD